MRPLPPEQQRLLARMHLHLAAALRPAQLRRLGWYDFRMYDGPSDADPVTMAAEVLLYLGTDADGVWTGLTPLLTGLIAFLADEVGLMPREGEVRLLRVILEQRPVRRQAVLDWFDQTYPR